MFLPVVRLLFIVFFCIFFRFCFSGPVPLTILAMDMNCWRRVRASLHASRPSHTRNTPSIHFLSLLTLHKPVYCYFCRFCFCFAANFLYCHLRNEAYRSAECHPHDSPIPPRGNSGQSPRLASVQWPWPRPNLPTAMPQTICPASVPQCRSVQFCPLQHSPP